MTDPGSILARHTKALDDKACRDEATHTERESGTSATHDTCPTCQGDGLVASSPFEYDGCPTCNTGDGPTGEIPRSEPRPKLELTGHDGNAMSVLGRAQAAARRAGWTPEQIKALFNEATAGDYDHLLATMMRRFDVS